MKQTNADWEKRLIETTLEFANVDEIHSTGEVEDLFRNLGFVGRPSKKGWVFNVLPKKEVNVFRQSRRTLRDLLDKISSRDPARLQEAIRETSKVLDAAVKGVTLGPGGELRMVGALDGVQACWAYALALLLNPDKGLTHRLGKCGAPGCDRFNINFEGRPRRHCNEEHRREADKLKAPKRTEKSRLKYKVLNRHRKGVTVKKIAHQLGVAEMEIRRILEEQRGVD